MRESPTTKVYTLQEILNRHPQSTRTSRQCKAPYITVFAFSVVCFCGFFLTIETKSIYYFHTTHSFVSPHSFRLFLPCFFFKSWIWFSTVKIFLLLTFACLLAPNLLLFDFSVVALSFPSLYFGIVFFWYFSSYFRPLFRPVLSYLCLWDKN